MHIFTEGLKTIDDKQSLKDPDIMTLIEQAGLNWSKKQYQIYSAICAAFIGAITALITQNPYIALMALGLSFVYAVKMYVKRRRQKRFNDFTNELPNALDQIVRSRKAGMSVQQAFRQVAKQAKEPVSTEFALLSEAQMLGVTTSEAIMRMTKRVPTPETNFLAIAVSMQAESGGRLSEALENLSDTIRERANMKREVRAMTSEVRASTAIITAIPILFCIGMYLYMPEYMAPLLNTQSGKIGLGIAVGWASIGLFLISKLSKIKI